MTRAQFDRKRVIEQSTQLFWQNGYSGSSMQQVFQATGLKPGSVYLAFGSKEGLYREALAAYANDSIETICRIIDASSVGEGTCHILESMVADTSNKHYCCCFLIKSQLELTAENASLREFVKENLQKIERLYQHYFSLEDTSTAKSRACSLMLHIFGLRVYGYLQPEKQLLLDGLALGLPWLPWKQ